MARPLGVVPADPPPIVGGSHDPLLQWALGESRAGLAILPEGSESGYRRFLAGEVIAAAIHFHDLDDPAKDANIEVVSKEPTLYDAVLIGFAAREQGLLVAAGNPLGLSSLERRRRQGRAAASCGRRRGRAAIAAGLLKRDGIAARDIAPGADRADRPRHRAGDPLRSCRLRHRHACGRDGGRGRFRAAADGTVRPCRRQRDSYRGRCRRSCRCLRRRFSPNVPPNSAVSTSAAQGSSDGRLRPFRFRAASRRSVRVNRVVEAGRVDSSTERTQAEQAISGATKSERQ